MLTLVCSPEVIVISGGVLKRGHVLFPLIRKKTVALLNGYVPLKRITGSVRVCMCVCMCMCMWV
jgi:hypothetical protein